MQFGHILKHKEYFLKSIELFLKRCNKCINIRGNLLLYLYILYLRNLFHRLTKCKSLFHSPLNKTNENMKELVVVVVEFRLCPGCWKCEDWYYVTVSDISRSILAIFSGKCHSN